MSVAEFKTGQRAAQSAGLPGELTSVIRSFGGFQLVASERGVYG